MEQYVMLSCIWRVLRRELAGPTLVMCRGKTVVVLSRLWLGADYHRCLGLSVEHLSCSLSGKSAGKNVSTSARGTWRAL